MENAFFLKDLQSFISTIEEVAIKHYNEFYYKNSEVWDDLSDSIVYENINFTDKVYLILKEENSENSAFVFKRTLWYNFNKIGYFKVLFDLEYKIIDDFFVLH